MSAREHYKPGPAAGAEVRKGGERWTLVLTRDLRHLPQAMGAAGWHICLDVLDRLLAGAPLGRIVGPEAMQFEWPRLNVEYATQFGVEAPAWPPQASRA